MQLYTGREHTLKSQILCVFVYMCDTQDSSLSLIMDPTTNGLSTKENIVS